MVVFELYSKLREVNYIYKSKQQQQQQQQKESIN